MRADFERIAGATMRRFGYDAAGGAPSATAEVMPQREPSRV